METLAQSFARLDGPLDLSALPQPGDVVDGKYRIDGTLGMGGRAIVLAATHLDLDEPVAIKMLLPLWSDDPELVERFVREGRAAIRIRSEHVVRVHDVGRVFRRPNLVTELLAGHDLAAVVDEMGHLPIAMAVDYVLQATEAVAKPPPAARTTPAVEQDSSNPYGAAISALPEDSSPLLNPVSPPTGGAP